MRRNLIGHRGGRLLAVAALMATAVTGAITAAAPPAFAIGFGQVAGPKAVDIGVGAGGTVWIVSQEGVADPATGQIVGGQVYRWNGSGWDKIMQSATVGAAGISIDVDREGNAWLVNKPGNIFHYNGTKFVGVAGPTVGPAATTPGATDIGVGSDTNESVWITGKDNNAHGHSIYRRIGSSWTQEPGQAVNLDVDPNGNAWVANTPNGNLYRWATNKFVPATQDGTPNTPQMQAFDVGIGGQGDLWITQFSTAGPDQFGFPVLGWTGSSWVAPPHNPEAMTISSGANKDPWVINNQHDIYHCSPNCH